VQLDVLQLPVRASCIVTLRKNMRIMALPDSTESPAHTLCTHNSNSG
jgi:hypothetical protein